MDLWRCNLQKRFARKGRKESMFPPPCFINSITSLTDVRCQKE